jgi:multicomponent Na+:H+ antiporter subunit F
MLDLLLQIALACLSIAILMCLYRVIRGPSMADRVIALDSIGINLISVTAVVSVMMRTHAFMEIILLIGILSFIGTIAFSKFIERGVVIEHNRRGD